jgi:Ca-activated chloride channel family protein
MGGVLGGIIGGTPTAAALPPPPAPGSLRHYPFPQPHENYSHFVENGFQSPTANPLSTFSIDVDTASYANMRRFLRNGNRPPIYSIRTEEWLNYFHYRYPDPEGDHPVSITTEVAASPWQPKHKLVRIGLKSRAVDTRDLPPANLVFLVDVSGSMNSPDKLPLLKRSFALLTEQLRPQDHVAIVVYAGAAGTVLPSASGADKARILEALEQLQAGGSTAGAQGIQLAYQTARAHFKPKGNNRVILATDGDFNVGMASEAELIRLIEKERDAGIYLTALGYGTGNYQDAKMKALSKHGNGNYAYVDTLLEARKVLVQEMGANLLTVAKDVKLQIEFNPAQVQAYRLIGYESRLLAAEDFNNDKKDAGELGAGHTVTALYEIVPHGVSGTLANVDALKYQKPQPTAAARSEELLTVKLRYKPPTSDVSKLLARTVEDSDARQTPSEDLRFAAAVAAFSMLLRDSEYKADATFGQVIALASQSLGDDPQGHRAEFLYLVKTAQGMTASQ